MKGVLPCRAMAALAAAASLTGCLSETLGEGGRVEGDDPANHVAESLLASTREVLQSRDFADNMYAAALAFGPVYLRSSDQTASGDDIVELIRSAPAPRYLRPSIWVVGRPHEVDKYRAETAADLWTASIWIGYGHVEEFASADVVSKSCAVNVMAHELTHTISTSSVAFAAAFSDSARDDEDPIERFDKASPVASYLVGSVAQCTYLQQRGRITKEGVIPCVRVFGVRSLNDTRCSQFAAGQPVSMRDDLSPEGPIL